MVANPHKGEVEFTVDGQAHTIRFNMNAICTIEEALGKGIGQVMDEIETAPKMSSIRTVLHALLVGDYALEDVGDLMDEMTPSEIMGHIAEAAKRSRSRRERISANPRKGGRGKIAAGSTSLTTASPPV